VPFPFFANSDLTVWQDDNELVLGTDYTVTGAGSPSGGLVTLNTGATAGDIITIQGLMPIDRTSIYSPTISNLTGTDLNSDFNRDIVMLKQLETTQKLLQLQYDPYAQVSQDDTVTVDRWLPILGPNQVWAKNPDNNEIIPYNVPEGGGIAPSVATYLLQTANADLPNAQTMGSLASGFVVNTTTTGVQLTRALTGRANQLDVQNPTGIGANPEIFFRNNPILPGTAGMGIPAGTTAQRVVPTPPSIGLRFNTDLNIIEAYIGGNWTSFALGDFLALAGGTMAGNIDMDGNEINNLPLPTNNEDAANKEYVDTFAEGLTVKAAVQAASTAAYTAVYDNGTAGVGATLTNDDTQAAFAADGETLTVGQRVLIKDQVDAAQNGIYTVTDEGDGASNWVLTRATDFDEPSNIVAGSLVPVLDGTDNGGTKWVQTADVTTVGTDDIDFILWMINVNRIVTTDTTQTVTGQKTFVAPILGDATGTSLNLGSSTTIDGFIDDDTMVTASDTTGATSESIKNYVTNREGLVFISSTVASSSATVDITDITGFTNYVVYMSNYVPATISSNLYLRYSTDNGSTFLSGGTDYRYQNLGIVGDVTGIAAGNSNGNSVIQLASNFTNVAGRAGMGVLELMNPNSGSYTTCFFHSTYVHGTSGFMRLYYTGGQATVTTSTVNAIRFFSSSGNITSGRFDLFGVK
jgi:hypothetical protein